MLSLTVHRAFGGDCILVRFGENESSLRRLLIDSGPARYSAQFRSLAEQLRSTDTLCITHIDSDHIGGLYRYLTQNRRLNCALWLPVYSCPLCREEDSVPLSVQQALRVLQRLQSVRHEAPRVSELRNIGPARCSFIGPSVERQDDIQYIVSSLNNAPRPLARQRDWGISFRQLMHRPCGEDASPSNAGSLVFLFEYKEKSILFTGDSTPDELEKGVSLLKKGRRIDYVKLSHHGSRQNTSLRWLEHIYCRNFIISSDGARLPDKQTIAVLLKYANGEPIHIFANHAWWKSGFFIEEDKSYIDEGLLTFTEVGNRPLSIA